METNDVRYFKPRQYRHLKDASENRNDLREEFRARRMYKITHEALRFVFNKKLLSRVVDLLGTSKNGIRGMTNM